MKNYLNMIFYKGLCIYLKIYSKQQWRKYFISDNKVIFIEILFLKKHKYYTTISTLIFLNCTYVVNAKNILSKKNQIISIKIKKTVFEKSLFFKKYQLDISALKKDISFKKIFLLSKQKWIFSTEEAKTILQSYNTNFVKIFFYESFSIFLYDINNHYAFAMTKAIPIQKNLKKALTLKKKGITSSIVINQKDPAFILSIFGLLDAFGTYNCTYFDNNFNNIQIHKFCFIPLIKKKQFIKILDYIKYFKIRKIKKEILVRLYGRFASNYWNYNKQKKNSPVPSYITFYSRSFINRILKMFTVYYTDTDSLFLKKPLSNYFLKGYMGYIKKVYKNYNIIHSYFIHEKRYCIFLLFNKKLFFFTTLNLKHGYYNFIWSYKLLSCYRKSSLIILNKNWNIHSFYIKRISIFQYNNLKLIKTVINKFKGT